MYPCQLRPDCRSALKGEFFLFGVVVVVLGGDVQAQGSRSTVGTDQHEINVDNKNLQATQRASSHGTCRVWSSMTLIKYERQGQNQAQAKSTAVEPHDPAVLDGELDHPFGHTGGSGFRVG